MRILLTGHNQPLGKRFFDVLHTPKHSLYVLAENECKGFFKTSFGKFDLVLHAVDQKELAAKIALDAELLVWAKKAKPDKLVYFSPVTDSTEITDDSYAYFVGEELMKKYCPHGLIVRIPRNKHSIDKVVQQSLNAIAERKEGIFKCRQ